jgi:hypothetical protein
MTVAWRVVSIAETGGTRVFFRSMMAPKFDVRGCGDRHREDDGGRAGAAESTRMTGAAA